MKKKNKNKNIIAWIFLNRIDRWERIDADISLCYGLSIDYGQCTPKIIMKNLTDNSNKYNTRINKWLTPTPIWNPSYETINWLLNFEKTDYMFYLHDCDWQIHVSSTNDQHNVLKNKYISNCR